MKKIAIFGASGNVGVWVTRKALSQGISVRALLRDPSKLPDDLLQKIEVYQGDVTKEEDVAETVKGVDGIVITLGTRNDLSATTVMSEGTKNILSAMKQHGVEKVSACISAFLFYDLKNLPERFVPLTEDHQRMLDCLKNSDVTWIAVLPPHFTDNPSSKYEVKEGASPSRSISKEDLGQFLLECLSKPEYYHKVLGIGNV